MHLIKTFTVGCLHNEPCPEPQKLFMHLWYNPALSTHLGTTLKLMNIRCWVKLISLFPQFVYCCWSIWYTSDSEADIEARSMKHAATEQCIVTSCALSVIVLPPPLPFTSVRWKLRVSGYSHHGLIRICCMYTFILYLFGGTRWRSWLRHCATSRKVAGSIPDGVVGFFHWHNPSGRTMALGSTQPLTEMSTRPCRSPAEILGSNPTGGMDICLLWVSCVAR